MSSVSHISEENHATAAGVAADLAQRLTASELSIRTVKMDEVEYYLLPDGFKPQRLDEFRKKPVRFKGLHPVADVPSFGKMVAHFEGHDRLVQFCKPSLSVLCVLNFPTKNTPAFADHQVKLKLGKHRDLLAWESKCNKALTQEEFMLFLEERLIDVTQEGAPDGAPSQSAIQTVIGNLQVTTDSKFTAKKDLHNGNYVFQSDSTTTPSIEVPRVFYIAVPIFEDDTEKYLIPVRLYYRILEGSLKFTISFTNFDRIFDDAWKTLHDAVIAVLPEGVPWLDVPTLSEAAK